jgi:hypothetical protein
MDKTIENIWIITNDVIDTITAEMCCIFLNIVTVFI